MHRGQPENTLVQEIRQRGLNLVQLVRRNKLQLIVSERVAMKTGQWELSGQKAERKDGSVFLSPVELMQQIQREEALDRYFLEQTLDVEGKLTLYYEDLFHEDGSFVKAPLAAVAEMLGTSDAFDVEPRLQKQRRSMADTITNFEDVSRAVNTLIKNGHIAPHYAEALA